ncbi:hypothetical protein S40288_11471 [Stachybotrys chartarum IBT 40288]|nr:hypothetical protein S40288_11471 [Stachybotrys chartarum IBT 40288]
MVEDDDDMLMAEDDDDPPMAEDYAFMLAPNINHQPNSSPIQLGAIIADPKISQTIWYKIGEAPSFFMQLLRMIICSPKPCVSRLFETPRLETRVLVTPPEDDEVNLTARLQELKVQAATRTKEERCYRPVYLISGLKIYYRDAGSQQAMTQFSYGVQTGASNLHEEEKEEDEGVIFAYQLLVIQQEITRDKGFTTDIYKPKHPLPPSETVVNI